MAAKTIIVIGGGSTGCATAHDLALRGFAVTLVERGEFASGTTGRCTCMIHSGGRYVVNDQESARECIEENAILRRIMPPLSMEENGGLFVSLGEDDPNFAERWFDGCVACGINATELTPNQAYSLEPNLIRNVRRAAIIPDAVIEPLRFSLSFAATAKANGAKLLTYTEVKELLVEQNRVIGVRVQDRVNGRIYDLKADLVVNAAGPWANKIAAMVDIPIPLSLSPGIHVIINKRLTQRVINRLHQPASGDVVVPHRNTTIIGTSSWTVTDCDYIPIPEAHIRQLLKNGAELIPAIKAYPIHSLNASARPLIASGGATERELSRTFKGFDHADRDHIEGFVTITGGKLVTARMMAEAIGNLICKKFGFDIPGKTRTFPLVSYRRLYLNR